MVRAEDGRQCPRPAEGKHGLCPSHIFKWWKLLVVGNGPVDVRVSAHATTSSTATTPTSSTAATRPNLSIRSQTRTRLPIDDWPLVIGLLNAWTVTTPGPSAPRDKPRLRPGYHCRSWPSFTGHRSSESLAWSASFADTPPRGTGSSRRLETRTRFRQGPGAGISAPAEARPAKPGVEPGPVGGPRAKRTGVKASGAELKRR